MASIIWTTLAKSDLKEIFKYIARDSLYYGESFVKKIQYETKKLKDFPKMGRIVPEFNDENLREIIFQNYRIIYKIRDEEVAILTIFHLARIIKFIK
ncbi:type II toxin-antitoxin system RelE/ParE family toxin [Thiospirochaeta perfilievii]|jgi:toxin ParE1/3/4|uniref:Type II toxin-antitoxin system RelE/ParE family toxin n=1 Tax=Thiospirochaeta perfilievii TaxID=252967 RepID=A0A5C1QBC5_9SPIO|nr:type II toxin-antitoxin system RelE/ParE family toxin [Thiospirochaeta perfilievii]QEN04350.1 type II toxin-antitoxin system RelE/ParE family toxin [Thiospirochaeta perfilievii]